MTGEVEKVSRHNTARDGASLKSPSSEQIPSFDKPEDTPDLADSTGPPQPDFPEGGWKAWGCVLGSFLAQMCGFGYTTSFGVYQDYYTRFYITSESPSTISWIGSVNAFILLSSGLFAGRLYDKGYFQYMKIGGSVLIILSLFTLSLTHPDRVYQNFLAQGVGHGLGSGIMFVPSLAVLSHYFARRRALVMSIVAAGSSLGAVIHPIMLNNLFVTLGFHNAVRASAGMITGLLILACLLMQPRLPPPTHAPDLKKSVKKFIRDGPYVWAALGLMIFPIGMYFPLFFIQLDSVTHGLGQNFSFYSLVIVNGASVIGRLTPGILMKYIPVVYMVPPCTLICAVLIFALSGVTTIAGFVILGILYGITAGAFIALLAPLISVLSDDIRELGLRMGLAFALCGPPVEGALLTEKLIWWKPAVLAGSFAVLGSVMFAMMAWMLRKRQQKDKRNFVRRQC